MGKVFKALEKYQKEMKSDRTPKTGGGSEADGVSPDSILKTAAEAPPKAPGKNGEKPQTSSPRVAIVGQPVTPLPRGETGGGASTASDGGGRKSEGAPRKERPAREAAPPRPAAAPPPKTRDDGPGPREYDPDQIDPNLVVLSAPQSYEAEQFKILRTNILFPKEGKPPKSILVTSAVPAEGKSFVAANLAISIAQNINEHVLLLDCDIRKPSIHGRFGFQGVLGLSEYLSSEIPLEALLLKTAVEKLTILPAGEPPDNPAELLSSEKMVHLLDEVKHRYQDRYIILDSPPPKLTAETSAIARYVDGIVLIVGLGQTMQQDVLELVGKIGKRKVLGTVVNRCDLWMPGVKKYKKYSKYYVRG